MKTYYMVDEEDPVLEKPEGTQIQWKEGKDPTIKVGAGTRRAGKVGDAWQEMPASKLWFGCSRWRCYTGRKTQE